MARLWLCGCRGRWARRRRAALRIGEGAARRFATVGDHLPHSQGQGLGFRRERRQLAPQIEHQARSRRADVRRAGSALMRPTCVDKVFELARRDTRVAYIGSDLDPPITRRMREEMPGRAFMEGVSEQHVVGMAAGLAMEGMIPYVHTIATFITRRCYEQVAVDLCLHNLPVRLIGNGGGLVYAPLGPTHLAIEDIAIMRALPGMAVVAVADAPEMRRLMEASLDWPGPLYIRLAKGYDPIVSRPELGFEIGKAILMREAGRGGDRALLVS